MVCTCDLTCVLNSIGVPPHAPIAGTTRLDKNWMALDRCFRAPGLQNGAGFVEVQPWVSWE